MSSSPRDTSQRMQVGEMNYQLEGFQNHMNGSTFMFESPTIYKLSKNHKKRVCYDTETIGEFPQNIAEFYWIYCNPAEDKFYGLCRLHCGLYAYFRLVEAGVNCFLQERTSKVVVSASREDLIQHAMSSTAYKKYMKKTVPKL